MRKALSSSEVSRHVKVALGVVAATLLVGAANSSWGASIGASFVGRGAANNVLGPTESAGAPPNAQIHWNNVFDDGTTFDGTTLSLRDDSDNFTSVKLIYDASDSWNSDGPEVTADDKLMKGIIKANPNPDLGPITNNSDRMLFVITNLPAGATYTVIVYLEENQGYNVNRADNTNSAKADVTVGSTTYYVDEEGTFGGTYLQGTSTLPGSYFVGNYVQFDNVAPAANGTITITAKKQIETPQVNDGIGVAGIQIVRTSGPAFLANTDSCSITNQPVGTAVADGATARFTVGTAGPCKVQWRRNGTEISGGTGQTLSYPATMADNNAQFVAVVYNNVNTNTSSPATLFVVAPVLTQGFSTVQRWEGIGGNTGSQGIRDLTNAIGAGPATTSFYSPSIDVPNSNPDISNFGAKVWGWVKPDVTGDYNFFIRSDDSSQLFLNQTAAASGTNALPDIYNDVPIAREDTCCNGFTEPPSPRTTAAPIHLEGGKLYGFVVLYKEGGGGDFVQVAWRQTTDTTPSSRLRPITPGNVWTMAAPVGQTASITKQPVSITVQETRRASFSVDAKTTPVAGTFGVQWLVDGTVVPGASGSTYSIASTALSDSGKKIKARVLTLLGAMDSNEATLTVIPDTFPPVPAANAITRADGAIQVGIGFDEPVNPADLIAANFSLVGGTSSTLSFPTNSYGDYKGILLDTTGLVPGNTYQVTVKNIRDVKGNAISASGTNVSFTVSANLGWADTGSPIRPGQVVPVGPDGFDILNGGRQEWNAYDEATIAYVKKTNDFDVKVQVIYAEPGSQWTRVGLMARNALNVGETAFDHVYTTNGSPSTASAYAQTHVNPNQTVGNSGRWDLNDPVQPVNPTPNNGHEQNARITAGATSQGWGSGVSGIPNYPDVWLRLARQGAQLHGYRSEDGVTWTDQGTLTLTDQQPNMYVGPFLAVETGNIWPGGTGAGSFDVWGPFNPTYHRLYVAQFRNFGNLASAVVPTINIGRSGSNLVITFTGTLQSSSTVNGTYGDLTGITSPYTVPTGSAAGFYRSRQ